MKRGLLEVFDAETHLNIFFFSFSASTTSLSGSDSETEGKQHGSDSFDDAFKADSLVEGTSSRYSMYNSVSQKLMVCQCLGWVPKPPPAE